MRSAVMLCLLAAACAGEEEYYVYIVAPADGTTITTTMPIVFDLSYQNVSCGTLFVDGNPWQPSSEVEVSASRVVWTPATIANGSHEIRISCEYDLVDYDDTITLVFARP